MHELAAVVILYNPPPDVWNHIQSYYSHVARVYLYDNSEAPAHCVDWTAFPKCMYFHDGENRGIAERLNTACAFAIREGYRWLLTMDQDSYFDTANIGAYIHQLEQFNHQEQVALFGPVHSDDPVRNTGTNNWRAVQTLITSGSIINLHFWKDVGGFDENLFIDSVDFEMCIKASLVQKSMVQFLSVELRHKVGVPVRRASIKSLYLVKKTKSLHPPVRYYYMLRNYLYLQHKYKGMNLPQIAHIKGVVRSRIVNAFLYGRNTRQLTRFLLLAFQHYRKGMMGKLKL